MHANKKKINLMIPRGTLWVSQEFLLRKAMAVLTPCRGLKNKLYKNWGSAQLHLNGAINSRNAALPLGLYSTLKYSSDREDPRSFFYRDVHCVLFGSCFSFLKK
jgi:hypothetical protein